MNGFLERYGPWALVTGASDGIGEAFARQLASHGMNLLLCARREDRLQTLAAELRTQHGVECKVLAVDLAAPGASAQLEAAAAQLDLGLLVAAAGFGSSGPFAISDAVEEECMLAVNCGAVLHQCRWLTPRLLARGRGGFILLSSLVAFQGCPGSAHYAATKAWVQTLAEGLRGELLSGGVDVLAVAPGPVSSGFGARARMNLSEATAPATVAAGALACLHRGGTVRPGVLAKLLGWSLSTAPRPLRVRMMSRIMRRLTISQ